MVAFIRFEPYGFDKLDQALRDLVAGSEDLRPVWDEVFADFFREEQRLWDTEGASGWKKWPRLKRRYAELKAKQYPGQPMMVATGKLRRAALGDPAGSRRDVRPRSALFVVNNPEGNANNRRRPVVQVTRAMRLRWYGMLIEHVSRNLARAEQAVP